MRLLPKGAVLSHAVVPDFVTPMHWSPPGSSVHGIFQARILEWVAISYSRESSLLQGIFPTKEWNLPRLDLLHW